MSQVLDSFAAEGKPIKQGEGPTGTSNTGRLSGTLAMLTYCAARLRPLSEEHRDQRRDRVFDFTLVASGDIAKSLA